LTLWRAFVLSLVLHAAAFGLGQLNLARLLPQGLARPPATALQVRVFTYAKEGRRGAPTEAAPAAAPQPSPPSQPSPLPDPRVPSERVVTLPTDTSLLSETVYETSELDVSPEVLSDITMEYPLAANNREGVVELAIVVGADGGVDNISVVRATPAGFFEEAALAGFRNARFSPGMLAGLGVKSRLLVEVQFMPINRGGAVSGAR